MSTFRRCFTIGLLAATLTCCFICRAADPTIAPLEDAPPAEEVSAEIRDVLDGGFIVMKSKTRALCQVWLRKRITTRTGFEPTLDELYAFEPGELIGVVHYKNKGADFRGQDIPPGAYTLRFALQPVDGDHVGTSDTRDFLLLVAATDDQTVAPIEREQLLGLSAEAVETGHPGMLCLQPGRRGDGGAKGGATIRHDEDRDWWIVDVAASDADGKTLPIALVVVGESEG
jgi:hypothetical protein